MSSFFHTYDLRGTFPDEIGEKEAEKVGKAFGTFTDAEKVLIGRDGREHGEKILEAFTEGLTSTGTDALVAGVVPTPVVKYGQYKNNLEASVIVTASHNPPEYTGFKFCKENALSMSREGGMAEIQEIYENEDFEQGEASVNELDVLEDYIKELVEIFGSLDLDVAVNCGNGVTGVLAEDLFESLASDVTLINEDVDGSFPNHLPDPTNEEARKALEEEMSDEDMGIIFDGDGDRAGFVMPGYGHISEDEVLALFSEEALEIEKGKVVYDLRASKLVSEMITKRGGEPVESRVGHTFISEAIHSDSSVVFAGELSGHFYFPAWDFPWDDGLFAAALMMKMLNEDKLEERLSSYTDYPVSPELRIDCPEDAKEKVIQKIGEAYSDREISRKDGVKIHFEKGWALVRPSSTEPKMSVRCEADTEEDLDQILQRIESDVRKFIQETSA
ncbi:phosphomannomutase/phosphoglucomutase [Candidatus Nanosalina sp. VS9-1]|uniref:phosphomannomutase/phosphoglucomutase n=1 Tax=Candidatus Nanosalina sp. VS9-1 TaxID=3388566 RepID=UPI0039E1C9EB